MRRLRFFVVAVLLLCDWHQVVRGAADIGSVSGHWESCLVSGQSITDIAVTANSPDLLYASATEVTANAGTGGVYRSDDGASTWISVSDGLPSLDISCVAVDAVNPDVVLAVSPSHFALSTNRGQSWWVSVTGALGNAWARCLAVDPINANILYIGSTGTYLPGPGGGVFRSTDRGMSWTRVASYLEVWDLAIDPQSCSTIYAGTQGGVFRSDDSGGTWTKASEGLVSLDVRCLVIGPSSQPTLYAGTGNGIFSSVDRGKSWQESSSGLANRDVYSIAVDPLDLSKVYAGTGGGVFASDDRGSSWALHAIELADMRVQCLAVDPANSARLYAGAIPEYRSSRTRGLYRFVSDVPPSSPSSLLLLPSSTVLTVQWSPSTPGSAALGGYAIYRSTSPGDILSTPLATVGSTVRTWIDTTSQQGFTYYYTVAAFDTASPPLFSPRTPETSAMLLPPLDTTPPLLTIGTPASGVSVSTSQLGILGTLSDTGSGVHSLMIDGGSVSLSPSGSFSFTAFLVPGPNTLTIVASDKAGNRTERRLTITYQQGTVLVLTVGSTYATRDGDGVYLDAPPIIVSGRTLVPLRFVAEAFGITPEWNDARKTIKLPLPGDRVLTLQIKQTFAFIEYTGTSRQPDRITLDVAPIISNGRTLVPIRFISEQFGAQVDYDSSTRTITIKH